MIIINAAFVVSDIHGQITQFKNILENWDREKQMLFILGDLIDRGEDSLAVVREVMKLKKLYGKQIVVLKGNHEDMLLTFLDNPTYETGNHFFMNGGNTTAMDFTSDEHLMFRSYQERAELMKERTDEIDFIRSFKDYYEFGDVLFVHGGIDPYIENWRNTQPHKFYWSRGWWNYSNRTGKTIVYGHTPTQTVYEDKSNEIWIDSKNKYINIDGGAVFGGQLNAIVIDKSGEILSLNTA
ncbi:serine/threonine protein phosphatase [Cytobacillus kochii]|uniref:metallophosphoesterase family protein n=1 Tax=Cytobacillus kochii TaxID=859143 RepID=UPI001CD7E21F|nr:metallophosphoesterase family protein [Cytobacillus kochii]MCA1027022.1 serine/threonine protein phosphatase [Cytobacillus kochii]